MNLSRLTGQSGIRLLVEGFAAGSVLLQTVIISRALGVEQTGYVLTAIASTQLGKAVLGLGSAHAVIWQLPRRPEHAKAVTSSVWIVAALASIPLAVVAISTAMIDLGPAYARIVQIAAVATLLQVIGDHLSASLRALQLLGAANVARFIQSLLSLVGVSVAALAAPSSTVVLVGWLSGWFAYALVAAAALRVQRLLGVRVERAIWREQLKFGLRILPGASAQQGARRLDLPLVALLAGPTAAGLYGVAVRTADVLVLIPQAVTFASYPAAARAAVGAEQTQSPHALRMTLAASSLLSVPLLLGAVWLLPLLLGAPFRAAVWPLALLLPGVVMWNVAQVRFAEFLANGWTRAYTRATVGCLALLSVLAVLLVPALGAVGAALSASTSYMLLGAATGRFHRRAGQAMPSPVHR